MEATKAKIEKLDKGLLIFNCVFNILGSTFFLVIRFTFNSCQRFYLNWLKSDPIIMLLVLPAMYYEELFMKKKMLREGLNTIKQMIREKKAALKQEGPEESDITSHQDENFEFNYKVVEDELLLEDDVYCKTFYLFLKTFDP